MPDVSVVTGFVNAISAGDIETALAHLHDEVQVYEPKGMPLDLGGDYRGKESFVGFLQKIASVYDIKIRGLHVIDGGKVAVAVVDLTWTAHSTGANLETQFCELYTVCDGKITEINVFPKDTRALSEIAVSPR